MWPTHGYFCSHSRPSDFEGSAEGFLLCRPKVAGCIFPQHQAQLDRNSPLTHLALVPWLHWLPWLKSLQFFWYVDTLQTFAQSKKTFVERAQYNANHRSINEQVSLRRATIMNDICALPLKKNNDEALAEVRGIKKSFSFGFLMDKLLNSHCISLTLFIVSLFYPSSKILLIPRKFKFLKLSNILKFNIAHCTWDLNFAILSYAVLFFPNVTILVLKVPSCIHYKNNTLKLIYCLGHHTSPDFEGYLQGSRINIKLLKCSKVYCIRCIYIVI